MLHAQSIAIEGNLLSYGTDGTVVELGQAIVKHKDVLERIVKLAEAEKTIELGADEIDNTRRRVSALEYVLIPQQAEDPASSSPSWKSWNWATSPAPCASNNSSPCKGRTAYTRKMGVLRLLSTHTAQPG